MTDREKLAALATQLGVDLDKPYKYRDEFINRATYDEQGYLIELNLNELNLIELPAEIGEFFLFTNTKVSRQPINRFTKYFS